MKDNNQLCTILIGLQRKNIRHSDKLKLKDIVRITKILPSNPFDDTDECCNVKQNTKYPVFFFNKTKRNFTRLFYLNFIAPLTTDHYVYHTCDSNKCMNIKHVYKKRYNRINRQYCKVALTTIKKKNGYKKKIIVSFD